jgi:hypothetical protein
MQTAKVEAQLADGEITTVRGHPGGLSAISLTGSIDALLARQAHQERG